MLILAPLVILLAAHVVAACVATRVLAARIEEENPPGGLFVPVAGGRLHVYDLGPSVSPAGPPILLLHGATSNARDMVVGVGTELARHHRVIAPDRPGHGWSDRPGGRADSSPSRQAALIAEALDRLGAGRVVVVGHSLAGAVATRFVLDHADRTAGLVLLSAVTHPWPGGITWYYRLAALPVIGALFVNTVMTPVGAWGLETAAAGAFPAGEGPADYATATSAALVLRPREFRRNGEDVADLKAHVAAQASRYGEIAVPTAILASEKDDIVSTDIHSRTMARQVAGSRLTVLRGASHQIHHTARTVVLGEIERIARAATP